jgi:fructuronate reductase
MERLRPSALSSLPSSVRRPTYDRDALTVGLAHIGVGAFHRCHQEDFTDDMLEARFGPWGVVGINLFPPRVGERLKPQDGLYSRTLREGPRAETRVIGALKRVIEVDGAGNAEAAVATLADPLIKAATITATEKGYCLTPATGALDRANPDIDSDLRGGFPPRTLLGLIALALDRRREAGGAGLTLLSCDNIPSNGERLRTGLIAFAAARSPVLADWIERRVAFPSSMVDRIVPATVAADLDTAAATLGLRDEAAVVGEPFRQWVIEDRFAGERPPWDLAGAEFVANAKPYETIKMRLLNGAQSTFAHLGALAGHDFSHQAADDPVLSAFVQAMLRRETAPTVPRVASMEPERYIASAMHRVRNTAIEHRCHQIGTDGSQKIGQRLLDPLRERLAAGQRADLLTLSVAAWIAYVLSGAKRFGARWAPSDPFAERILAIGDAAANLEDTAASVLALKPIFGEDLQRADLAEALGEALAGLLEGEPRAYLQRRMNHA